MLHRSAALSIVILFSCWLLSAPLACFFGPYELRPEQVINILTHIFTPLQDDKTDWIVVSHLRLARACSALFCGGALACSGAILQGALRNPLADPFTLGISAGAACGASLAIIFVDKASFMPDFVHIPLITTLALAGAMLALVCALVLGRGGGTYGKENIILAGIAVAAFLGALVALVKALNEDSVTSIVFWIMGSLQGRGWDAMPLLLITGIPGIFLAILDWRKLDILSLGDEQAAQLGVNPHASRFRLLAGASLMTAGCVSVCGIIGFVGLVVPHILRLVLGPAHGPLLVAAFFGGGLFLLGADCLARIVLDGGQELPVGVVTALAGGPFFAFLIWKRK